MGSTQILTWRASRLMGVMGLGRPMHMRIIRRLMAVGLRWWLTAAVGSRSLMTTGLESRRTVRHGGPWA